MTERPPIFARLSRDAQHEIERVQTGLPQDLREEAAKVPVVFEMRAERALLEAGETEDDLLGLFVGEAYDETAGDTPVPPQIYLFLANIWDYAEGDQRVYLREVRKTYLHELGHFLGLGESELEDRGMD